MIIAKLHKSFFQLHSGKKTHFHINFYSSKKQDIEFINYLQHPMSTWYIFNSFHNLYSLLSGVFEMNTIFRELKKNNSVLFNCNIMSSGSMRLISFSNINV